MMENDELLERAQFGRQVELFWGSQLGGYLRNRAQDMYTTALEELKNCDPTDSRKVMKFQNDVKVAEYFETWLSEAVIDGAKSLELLEDDDES
jgi:hypothetical protein